MSCVVRKYNPYLIINESLLNNMGASYSYNSCIESSACCDVSQVTEAVRGMVLDIRKPPNSHDKVSYWNRFISYPNINTFTNCVKDKFEGIISRHKPEEDDNLTLQTNWFKKMVHLKLLQMNNTKLEGDFKYMSSELRWLQWRGCSQKTLPDNLPEEIRVLDLSGSKIERLWCSDRSFWGFNKVNCMFFRTKLNAPELNCQLSPKRTGLSVLVQ